jgi:hypothetical protein
MLVVRAEQMAALGEHMVRLFEKRMARHLLSRFPEHLREMEEPDLCRFIQDGIKRAQRYSVTFENDTRRYLECAVLYGAEFDRAEESNWAGEILRRRDLNGTKKMDLIDAYERYGHQGWNS